VVLIPALEKSGDEAANLGKIVASCLKGMMGATLGNTVEGGWENAVGSKQTRSSSSFMTVFDEVGYYTAAGMAVMAAQARSLGFSLVFAAQDLPSMEKRVKQEAKSIVGNCNLKILGRIEDPTDTRDFVTKHGGSSWVMEASGYNAPTNTVAGLFMNMPFHDGRSANYTIRQRVDYDHLRGQREGEAHLIFGDWACKVQMLYTVPEKAKALRVHRFLPVPSVTKSTEAHDRVVLELTSRLKDGDWAAAKVGGTIKESPEIAAIAKTIKLAANANLPALEMGIVSMACVFTLPAVPKTVSGAEQRSTVAKSGRPQEFYGADDEGLDADQQAFFDDVSPEERAARRANMPPLYPGDEFAIDEVEEGYESDAADESGYAPREAHAFAGTDADLSAIIPTLDGEEDAGDFSFADLPDNIKAVLAESAQRMNEGLRGKSARE
ncbi:MAG: TraM recognition domain-containing protein, partial [Alphaproteobacteria bacterium]|nr:TraM recognition domain-containing protein [Alphaproteobacteria bacterium]